MNDKIDSAQRNIVEGTDSGDSPQSPARAWDRMPRESARAYDAAWQYFRMGAAGRSQSAVAGKLRKRLSQMQRWSTRWSWVSRAAAYDDHLASIELLAIEKKTSEEAAKWAQRRADHRENKYRRGEKLENTADQMLKFPLASSTTLDGKTIVRPTRWGMKDVVTFFAEGARMKEEAIEEVVGKDGDEREENWITEDYIP